MLDKNRNPIKPNSCYARVEDGRAQELYLSHSDADETWFSMDQSDCDVSTVAEEFYGNQATLLASQLIPA